MRCCGDRTDVSPPACGAGLERIVVQPPPGHRQFHLPKSEYFPRSHICPKIIICPKVTIGPNEYQPLFSRGFFDKYRFRKMESFHPLSGICVCVC